MSEKIQVEYHTFGTSNAFSYLPSLRMMRMEPKISFCMRVITGSSNPVKRRTINIRNPYGSIFMKLLWALLGRKPMRTFEPSRGGIGIRFNAPRIVFTLATTKSRVE